MDFMKLLGVAGLLLIIIGTIVQNRNHRNYLFIAGGILLEIYSIYIGDLIFIILQAVFVVAALYDLLKPRKRRGE